MQGIENRARKRRLRTTAIAAFLALAGIGATALAPSTVRSAEAEKGTAPTRPRPPQLPKIPSLPLPASPQRPAPDAESPGSVQPDGIVLEVAWLRAESGSSRRTDGCILDRAGRVFAYAGGSLEQAVETEEMIVDIAAFADHLAAPMEFLGTVPPDQVAMLAEEARARYPHNLVERSARSGLFAWSPGADGAQRRLALGAWPTPAGPVDGDLYAVVRAWAANIFPAECAPVPAGPAPMPGAWQQCAALAFERVKPCPTVLDPVCANVDTGKRCVAAPCPGVYERRTYPNACEACRRGPGRPVVLRYRAGSCESSEANPRD